MGGTNRGNRGNRGAAGEGDRRARREGKEPREEERGENLADEVTGLGEKIGETMRKRERRLG